MQVGKGAIARRSGLTSVGSGRRERLLIAWRAPPIVGHPPHVPRHTDAEQRFVLLGYSQAERLVTVMFTDRGEAIRIISARPATRQERRDYEKGKS